MKAKIVADRNIPFLQQACEYLPVDIHHYDSTEIEMLAALLKDARALLCRSTIQVRKPLLDGSSVRYVATATAGVDHFDVPYLESLGIAHASAAGSNARSVAEYVFTTLFRLAMEKGISLKGKKLGIVGVGHVGSLLLELGSALGFDCLCCDPPRAEREPSFVSLPYETVLAQSDILTFHAPLERTGRYPTWNMLNDSHFPMLKDGIILFNTARGGVVNEKALVALRASGKCSLLVLDVFEGEPAINPATFALADVATPHIAGHSYDGKLKGTQMVYEGLCAFLNIEPQWHYSSVLPMENIPLHPVENARSWEEAIAGYLSQTYNPKIDHEALAGIVQFDEPERGNAFSRYRNNYPVRREFNAYGMPESVGGEIRETLRKLGFGSEGS